MKRKFLLLLVLAGWTSLAPAADSPAEKLPAPLFKGLGDLHHPVSTVSGKAQDYFEQGLMLCYAFNHREAIRSFRAAAQIDPNCPMAFWGVAYAHGPHVNKPMSKEENDAAWAALQQALALQTKGTPKEQAYIKAMAARYQAIYAEDRAALDKAYAAGMRQVAREFPDDLDAQVLLAEALMDTMPWDYWTKDRSPKPETEEALAALRFVMARNPNHPAANHFYIHAVEAGPNPELGLPSADRLGSYAPNAGHLVHMPAHIYVRVGQYHDATIANENAVKADRNYLRHCRAQGFYPGVYYPHNLHFLWWAQLLEGRSADALRSANKAADYAIENYCGPRKALEAPRLRHLPWITWARFGRWDEILKVPQPATTNDFLIDRALWHFTRGLALAAEKKPAEAARELAALRQLSRGEEANKLNNPQFPASSILGLADQWLAGRVAAAQGDYPTAIAQLKKAVEASDTIPYMEPPYWPFSARPTLGAVQLAAGDAAAAEQIFREDLKRWPRNGWSLFGLAASLRQAGKTQSADLVQREFDEAWKHADTKLDLHWF